MHFFSAIISIADRKHWKTGLENIKTGLNINEKATRQLLKKVYANMALNAVELFRFLINPEKMLKHVKVKNPEKGKGQRIFFSAHLSNWEIMVFAHAIIQNQPVAIVGKKIKNRYFNWILSRLRKRGNIEVVNLNDGRRIIRLIKKGYSIGFLIDQFPVEKASCEVKFFGRNTRCMIAPAKLSELYEIPMQGGFIKRKKGELLLFYTELIPHDIPLNKKMQLATSIIEEEIRKRPEEWMWLHKRWR